MLTITVPGGDGFDEETGRFTTDKQGEVVLELEHSLVALSKWESIFKKPFLTEEERTSEEILAYFECMILTPNFPRGISARFTQENADTISEYMSDSQTATWFSDGANAPKSREIITSELIYFWLTAFNIPFEVQYWNLNRLLVLIKVANLKNAKPKKMNSHEAMARQRALNEQRLKDYGTSG